MARRTMTSAAEMRAAIQAAVDDDCITPTEVLEWLEDNDFEPLPTRSTVINILPSCGVVLLREAWVRKSELEADDDW